VIHSFRSPEAALLHARQPVERFTKIARLAQRRLLHLDAAAELRDLEASPNHHLEKLTGKREGQHSIRITEQWRLCFAWCGAACDVEITMFFEGTHLPASGKTPTSSESTPEVEMLTSTPASGKLPPIPPGEILIEDFLKPLRITMNRLALDLRVPMTRITRIVQGQRVLMPDTALRLARYFNTSARFWVNVQSIYDLELAHDELHADIERDVRPLAS
jgi:addiction module HigA family antidote